MACPYGWRRRGETSEVKVVIFGVEEVDQDGAGALGLIFEAREGGYGEGGATEGGENGETLLEGETLAPFPRGNGVGDARWTLARPSGCQDSRREDAQEVDLMHGALGRGGVEHLALFAREELTVEARRGGSLQLMLPPDEGLRQGPPAVAARSRPAAGESGFCEHGGILQDKCSESRRNVFTLHKNGVIFGIGD